MPIHIQKHILLYGVSATLAGAFLVVSILRESSHQAEVRLGLAAPSPVGRQQMQTPPIPVHTAYQLPYPGILPTHPFYSLKMIRDKVQLTLTFNHETQTRLLLLYANKRMAAAKLLAEQGKMDEALTVATKAETYLSRAISQSLWIPAAKQPSWFDELKRTCLKHEEIIEELDKIAPSFGNNQAVRLYKYLGQLREQIVSVSHVPFGYLRPEDAVTAVFESIPAASPHI